MFQQAEWRLSMSYWWRSFRGKCHWTMALLTRSTNDTREWSLSHVMPCVSPTPRNKKSKQQKAQQQRRQQRQTCFFRKKDLSEFVFFRPWWQKDVSPWIPGIAVPMTLQSLPISLPLQLFKQKPSTWAAVCWVGQFRVSSSSPNIAVTVMACARMILFVQRFSVFPSAVVLNHEEKGTWRDCCADGVVSDYLSQELRMMMIFSSPCNDLLKPKARKAKSQQKYTKLHPFAKYHNSVRFLPWVCNGTMANSMDPGEKILPAEQPWLHPCCKFLACEADVAITSLGWMKAMVWTLWNPRLGNAFGLNMPRLGSACLILISLIETSLAFRVHFVVLSGWGGYIALNCGVCVAGVEKSALETVWKWFASLRKMIGEDWNHGMLHMGSFQDLTRP